MLSTPIVLESLDSPLLLEIAAFYPGLLEVSSHFACCRMLLCVAGWHIRCAFFDKRDEGDASVSLGVFLLAFQF